MSTIAHLTLAEYDRMIACGVFDHGRRRRIEFIRGEIREMTPSGSLHEVVVDRLAEVVEVAENSLAYDSGEKADLYAAAAIADYWVVNLIDRTIEVRRDPAAGAYRSLQAFAGDDDLRPLAVPGIRLRPASLWPSP